MGDEVDLRWIQFDPDQAVRELRQDFKDDWFPDTLAYRDLLDGQVLSECIRANLAGNDGFFLATRACEQNIPKRRFTLRYALETPYVDRAYFHLLAAQLVPFYDPLLPPNALSHRWNQDQKRGRRYIFKHPIRQWQKFQRYVRDEAGTKDAILVTDVQNYFENIQVDILEQTLRSSISRIKAPPSDLAQIQATISELRRCLESWCFRPTNGLPQNRDASSILANAYMLPVDDVMLSKGYRYYRYMDDIRIVVSDKYEARSALQVLIGELRKRHLNVNGGKTHIAEPGDAEWREATGEGEQVLRDIDHMWGTRSERLIVKSLPYLLEYARRLISEGRTQDRGFRFCMNRFGSLALCDDFTLDKSYFDNISDQVIEELLEQPYSTDQLARYLKAAPLDGSQLDRIALLLADPSKAIYDWQNFHLWQVLLHQNHVTDAVVSLARSRALKSTRIGDRAGSFLYLGAYGSDADRESIASRFGECASPTEHRAALVAIHELPWGKAMKEHVAPNMPPPQKGVYRRLSNWKDRGTYFYPLERVSFRQLFDQVAAYD